jgi:putative zinc finger/helix-turn-helix YgiT family protein
MKSPFTDGEALLLSEKKTLEFRKDEFTITQFFYKCADTGETFTTDALDQVNINQLYNQYREKYGVPFPDEINQVREQYGLSATKMSEILGFGVNSYRQYESGDIPTVANGRLIQAAKDPEEFRKFIDDSKAILTEREYARFVQKVEVLIEEKRKNLWDNLLTKQIFSHAKPTAFTGYRKPSIEKIAAMIACFSERITDLWKTKLNKLLFYADFLHYKRTGYSISGTAYRAIPFGPVPAEYDKLYVKLKDDTLADILFIEFDNGNYGEAIQAKKKFEEDVFTPAERDTLNEVVLKFGSWNTKQLVNASHNESAWAENVGAYGLISYQEYAFELRGIA